MGYPAVKPHISVEDYLEGEQVAEVRHEYFDGTVRAMAGATVRHNTACGFLTSALRAHLAGGPCKTFSIDVKLRTKARERDLFYYPDVMVCCDSRDQNPLYREHPKLIVEVLSTDENRDLFEKLYVYQRIDTLEEYVIVRPEPDAGKFEVFRHLRSEGWDPGITVTSGVLRLESIGLDVDLDALREELASV